MKLGDFYEDDEPAEKILAILRRPVDFVTGEALPHVYVPHVWAQMITEMRLPDNYGTPGHTYADLTAETEGAAYAALAVLGPAQS